MEKRGTGRRNTPGMIPALALALLSIWSRAAAGPHHSSMRILRVLLSSYAAELQWDGQKLDKTGFDRLFKIPEEIVLPAGAEVLELTVILKPNNYTTITRTRRVNIIGGADMIVGLREEDPVTGTMGPPPETADVSYFWAGAGAGTDPRFLKFSMALKTRKKEPCVSCRHMGLKLNMTT